MIVISPWLCELDLEGCVGWGLVVRVVVLDLVEKKLFDYTPAQLSR